MKDFTEKAEAYSNIAINIFPRSIVVLRDEKRTSISLKGTPYELLRMTNALVGSLRKSMEENLPKPLVKDLLRSIIMTDAELEEEAKVMKEKREKRENEIPAWLKKLMELEEEDDDEDEDSVSDSDPDDEDEVARREAVSRLADALHHALHGDLSADVSDSDD